MADTPHRRPKRVDPWRTREESSLLLGTVLWFAARLRRPLVALGVDYPIFRELLRARIVIDQRGPAMSAMGVAGIVLLLMATGMMGLLSGILAVKGELATWLVVSQSGLLLLLFFYLTQSLIGMLVDPTDLCVLAPHPVPDRTLYAVRLAQVFAYLAMLSAAFGAGNLLLALVGQPPLATLLVFPLVSLASTLTALGAVALAFSLILRLVGPAHFQRVSLWAQIGGAVMFMGGFQVGTHVIPEQALDRIFEHPLTEFAWPPLQFARVGALALGDWSRRTWIAIGYTVGMPVLALFVALRLASRSYVAGLAGSLEPGGRARARWPRNSVTRLASVCRLGREQRAAFEFAATLSAREAHVLRAILPQLIGFQAAALATGMSLQRFGGTSVLLSYSSGMLALVVPNLLEMCQGSSTPEARWIFVASPLRSEAELVRGGMKGLMATWYGGCLALVAIAQLCVAGPGQILSILLGLELSIAVALGYARAWSLGVPFTRAPKKQSVDNIGLVMSMFLVLGALGVLHWALSRFALVQGAAVLLLTLPVWLLWRSLDRMPVGKGHSLSADGSRA